MTQKNPVESWETAKKFHELYEKYAPDFGYETRKDTKAFDPESPNGKLMTKVCNEIVATQREALLVEMLEEIGEDEPESVDDENYMAKIFINGERRRNRSLLLAKWEKI